MEPARLVVLLIEIEIKTVGEGAVGERYDLAAVDREIEPVEPAPDVAPVEPARPFLGPFEIVVGLRVADPVAPRLDIAPLLRHATCRRIPGLLGMRDAGKAQQDQKTDQPREHAAHLQEAGVSAVVADGAGAPPVAPSNSVSTGLPTAVKPASLSS